jgi:hypothetical protein
MENGDDLGPFKALMTAGAALLSMGTFVITKWVGFLTPPPHIYYGRAGDFWLPLATICTGVTCALALLFLPSKRTSASKLKVRLALITFVTLIGFFVISIVYENQKSKWTFTFRGETVLIGDRYTEAGKADSKRPGISEEILFKDFGYHSLDIWTQQGLQRRYMRLGIIYVSAAVIGGLCFSLAAWIVLNLMNYPNKRGAAGTH